MNEAKMRTMSALVAGKLNPRGGVYDEEKITALMESLRAVGQQDAVHVWVRPGIAEEEVLKGNRRLEAMRRLGWTECLQVVHSFEDEREAYLYLLQDHGHTVALSPWERCVAARNGVKIGLTAEDLAPACGVEVARVQLWLDLESGLPFKAKMALSDGSLSVNTAELLLRVAKDQRAQAAQEVLKDAITGEVMAPGEAKRVIEAKYLRPERWRKEWEVLLPKLKKRMPVAEGFTYAAFEDRLEWVMGDTGQPRAGFEFGDGHVPGEGGDTWADVAQALGVEVVVVCAPLHKDGHVTVVSARLIKEARESGEQWGDVEGEMEIEKSKLENGEGEVADVGEDSGPAGAAEGDEAAELVARLGVVFERITADPAKVMVSGMWEGFLEGLCEEAANDAWPMVRGLTRCEHLGELKSKVKGDYKHRGALRWCFMLLLCGEIGRGELAALTRAEGELGVR